MNFSKLILFLFLLSILQELQAFKTWDRFFWDTLYFGTSDVLKHVHNSLLPNEEWLRGQGWCAT